MAVVHIPRIRGNFGGVVIPRVLFDGCKPGLGVFCSDRHPDPAAVERDVRRLSKGHNVSFAGRLELPGGVLLGIEMPDDPAKMFMQLGLSQSEVRDQVNAVNLRDPSEEDIVNRWRGFQQLNHRSLESASDAEKAAFDMRSVEVGFNGKGSLVLETPFGRTFSDAGAMHAEWQTAKDGLRKGQGGRASLFLRAHDWRDWAFLARGLVAQLHRYPEQPIGTQDLQHLIGVAQTAEMPDIGMDQLRELIEAEVALVRGQRAVEGREFAEAVSVGFPPHDPSDRGGRRVVYAQFSTPPAVGEIAAEFLKPDGRTIFEPTIGNGVFASATYASGGLVYGVELDDARHGRVAGALPEARITLGDAMDEGTWIKPTVELNADGKFDAVLANPPYGKPDDVLEKVRFEDFGLELPAKKLETHISAQAVNALREGGNAVLVMPAQMMRPSELTEESRRFQTMLNSVFQKVDSVVLDASLYRNMGSNFPVIVHFCEDRRPDGEPLHIAEAAAAVPQSLEVMGTFGAFYEHATRIIQSSKIEALTLDEANDRRVLFLGGTEPLDLDALNEAQEANDGVDGLERPTEAPESPHSTSGASVGSDNGSDGPESDDTPSGEVEGQELGTGVGDEVPVEEDQVAEIETDVAINDLVAPSQLDTREWFVDDFSPDPFTVPYTPRSQKGTTLAVIERTMANETYTALRRVEEAVDMTVDEYVAGRMGIPLEDFMSDKVLFYPEQVDSLALSFFRREQPKATIIGDQMGVGKGIQLAAHAYSSMAVENRPVLFMTNRANLFSDLCIRDWKNASNERFLDMVNEGSVRPFIFNADGALRENEKIVFSTPPDARKKAATNKDIGNPNLVMMTYSQVQNASGAWRHVAIKDWITRNAEADQKPVILLDEVHKAAGEESRTGMVIQDMIAHAERLGAEIIYSSATSLKSGRNLPVYTPALPDTGLSTQELLLAIEKMPLAMQEILASEMAKDGALIERKMSDAGVNRDLVVLADVDSEKMDRTRVMTDRVSALLRELSDMGPIIADAARRQFSTGLGGSMMAGSADKVRVETTSIASQLDSFSRYLMGAVKGQFVSELMQDAVSRGHKPSVVCEYTADSVSEFVIGGQLPLITQPEGVPVAGHPNVGDVLKRFAEKSLTFKGMDGLGNISELRVEGFDDWLHEYVDSVDGANVGDLRVNVFDRAREAAETMGMTFEDITGRKYEFREDETGQVRAYSREKPVLADAVARYNRGQTDVLALNSGSATGVSAQASPAHGNDVRRREMIKLAFQREITDERQVEGRVHRAGQVVPPRYTIPVTGFAPDDRIANLFNRANRSLTSSTSATRENRTNADHAVDILNPVGEKAAIQVLKRSPAIADMLQIDPEKTQDVARKLLGRSVMLPLAEQSAVLSEVDATFRVIADRLTSEGSNPLRLQFYEWGAKVDAIEELIPGDPGSQGIAGQPLSLNQINYEEKVESLPARTVISNIMNRAHRREEPFENMHKAWSYPELIDRGAINYEHHLFGSVTGRKQEGMRYLWPQPLPGEVSERLMDVMHRFVNIETGRSDRPINNDELRDVTEKMANQLLDDRSRDHVFNAYRDEVTARLGDEAFKPSSIAVSLRAMWNRSEQARRLNTILPLIEPGNMIALDARSLNSVQGGMWASAYEKMDIKGGLVPAIITSARYDPDSPFSESKMSFSAFVPGSRYTERLTLSTLHTGMEISGAPDKAPIRPFSSFLAGMEGQRSQYRAGMQDAMQSAVKEFVEPEKLEAFQAKLAAVREANGGPEGLEKVVGGGVELTKHGGVIFQSLCDIMPQQTRKQQRMTLEGNLFAAMSAVSSSVASATSGEKVVYTDQDGTHRNAILLNNRLTDQLVENVRRKVSKRSIVHSGLSSEGAVADYLRLANAIQFGVGYYDEDGEAEVVSALERFFPEEFGGDAKQRSVDNFAELMAGIRGRMDTVESTFPPSVMTGGDIWRWGTDLAQKAAMQSDKPRGFIPGVGGPSTMTVRVDDDVNVLGFRDAEIRTGIQGHALAAAASAIDKTQALAVSIKQGEITLVLHKDHPAFKDAGGVELMDTMNQRMFDVKLKSGVLAGEFSLSDPAAREVVSKVLVGTGTGKLEVLIGGAMKEIQKGINNEAGDRQKARLKAGLENDASVDQPQQAPVETTKPVVRPAYGAGGVHNGPS